MSNLPEVPAELVRQQWAVYHNTIRRLGVVDGLTTRGLELVRFDLRTNGRWAPTHVPVGFEGQAALLRNDVAESLVQVRGEAFRAYYAGTGDLLPAALDDVSSLEES